MKFYSYLIICSLFLVGCQDQSDVNLQDLIPYENKGLGLWGYRDQKTGDIVIEPKYDEVGKFSDKMAPARIGQKWGAINPKGKIIIEPKFDKMSDFSNGKTWITNSDGVFLMDTRGKFSVSLTYDNVGYFSEGLCKVEQDNKYGFIDKAGHPPFPNLNQ